jgi:hypothetical protein
LAECIFDDRSTLDRPVRRFNTSNAVRLFLAWGVAPSFTISGL